MTAHLAMHVQVPALNRWLKLYSPLAFWHVGTCLNYAHVGFQVLKARMPTDASFLDVDRLVGLVDD
eukprot:4679592-Alexandrium_andersonii.AAC.1